VTELLIIVSLTSLAAQRGRAMLCTVEILSHTRSREFTPWSWWCV